MVKLNGKRNGAVLNSEYIKEKMPDYQNNHAASLILCYNQFVLNRFEVEKQQIVDSVVNSVKYQLFSSEIKPHWFMMRYFAPIT